MNNRLDEVEKELVNISVTKDQFAMWKDNDVTRRFLLEVEKDLLETQQRTTMSASIESIAIYEIKRSEHAETLEAILDWNPTTDSE